MVEPDRCLTHRASGALGASPMASIHRRIDQWCVPYSPKFAFQGLENNDDDYVEEIMNDLIDE